MPFGRAGGVSRSCPGFVSEYPGQFLLPLPLVEPIHNPSPVQDQQPQNKGRIIRLVPASPSLPPHKGCLQAGRRKKHPPSPAGSHVVPTGAGGSRTGKRLPSGLQAQHPTSARLQKPGKQIWVPPSLCPTPRCCAAAGSENTIKIMSCCLSIINDQNKFTALCLITLLDFHLNICKEMGPHSTSLSDGCKCCICRERPGGTRPTFTGKVLFSCCRTKQQQGEEEKLGRDEISPISAMCSCLDAAEHLQPQLSICYLCS